VTKEKRFISPTPDQNKIPLGSDDPTERIQFNPSPRRIKVGRNPPRRNPPRRNITGSHFRKKYESQQGGAMLYNFLLPLSPTIDI
jgi:hypothetical protein